MRPQHNSGEQDFLSGNHSSTTTTTTNKKAEQTTTIRTSITTTSWGKQAYKNTDWYC